MNLNICNNCGGDYIYRNGRWICQSCGSYKPEEISNEEVTLLYMASQKLRLAKFSEAEQEFNDIIQNYPQNPHAYWGRLKAKYGIKYEKDYGGQCIPTCYATSIESVFESSDYHKALKFADEQTKASFQKDAAYMEQVRKDWLEKASREKPYDIFISYKDSEDEETLKGDRSVREHTADSDELRELYLYLLKKGYRVFFSRESLDGTGGAKYEPFIYGALSTAKVMLVYGSKPEYINATWVRNEWTRYQKRISEGEKHPDSLIVAYKGFSPKDLPTELSEANRQHLDASKPSFYNELLETVERIIDESRKLGAASKKESVKKTAEPKKVISPLHEHSYKTTVVKSTCVERGYTLHQCACGEEYKDNYLPLADHKFKITEKIEPTCTEEGKEVKTCEVCGDKQITPIPALGHQFSKWIEAKHPTCTQDGEEQRQCQRCGEVEKKAIPKTGHAFGGWVKDSDGMYTSTCKNCGETKRKRASEKNSSSKSVKGGVYAIAFLLIAVICCGIFIFVGETGGSKSSIGSEATTAKPSIGQTITFGSYEQDNNTSNGKEAIEWIVLDIQDGKALVISKYALDSKPFNETPTSVTWETCTLRTWLNDDFLNSAFSESEKSKIPTVTVSADKNPDYRTKPGNATQDQIFLLSITEANKYFSSDSARECQPTAYAKAQGAWTSSSGTCRWWLRSPGYSQNYAADVDYGGDVDYSGSYVYGSDYAVRPALWIDLES